MGRNLMARTVMAATAALMLATQPAAAQMSDGYNFLKAVKDRDGNKATELLQGAAGASIINTKDYDAGEGALHIVVRRRDDLWLRFLLGKGANPNIRNKEGSTPLHVAAQIGFPEAVSSLIGSRADVNMANDRGETPLILAVQQRDAVSVKLLLAAGANPAKADHIAGMSARDYAERDPRAAALLRIIDESAKAAKPAPARISGPGL